MAECSMDNLEQTMFLGCSVIDFSCSLGFNEQPTQVTVRLVRDTCAATVPKIYYDIKSSDSVIRKEWSDADPGFESYGINSNEPPQLGAPVYFRVANFEFMGILQSWTKQNTRSDQDLYDVILVSPTEILAGCQVVIGDYSGPIKGFNIFNAYGFLEVFSSNDLAPTYIDPRFPEDGPIMGTYANAFGGANENAVGMTWNKIKEGIQILTSSLIPVNTLGYEEFSEVGRICYFGGQVGAKFGLIERDDLNISVGLAFGLANELAYYYLDITELPNVPDDYRIPGPNISLLSLIAQICSDFGFDFYLELLPIKEANILRKIIKIRAISRLQQPDTSIVQQFITATPEVIDSSFGRELRNENTTTFLVGGQKQNIVQIDNGLPDPDEDPEEIWLNTNFGTEDFVRDRIAPFFGTDSDGDAYVLNTISITNPNNYYLNLEINSRHNWKILGSLLPATIQVTVGEMRAAEAGYDSWTTYSKTNNTHLNQIITNAGLKIDLVLHGTVLNSKITARDLVQLNAKEVIDQFAYEMRAYRQTIADIYTKAKSTLMVRVPWVVARYEIDSSTIANTVADLQVQYTDEPSEGGWTQSASILYLANPGTYVDRMRLDNGLVRPFAMFDILDTIVGTGTGTALLSTSTSQFETETSFAIDRQTDAGLNDPGKLLYYAFNQEQQLVYLDRTNLVSPRVIIAFNSSLDFENDSNPFFAKEGWRFGVGAAQGAVIEQIDRKSVEPEVLINHFSPPLREPNAVAIALKSNNYVYGPWKPDNIIEAGPPGQIRFQKEEDLVPWTYGSYFNLNTIAQERANSYVTTMTEGELGTVTVFGWPSVPIGAEIGSLTGLTDQFFVNNEHLIENRISSFNSIVLTKSDGSNILFSIPNFGFGIWDGAFGPTVTNINIEISTPNTIQTTYTFRTYTPQFGILSKLNAARLEQRFILENQRQAKQRFFEEMSRVRRNHIRQIRAISNGIQNAIAGDVRAQKGTPHSVFVGQLNKWDSNIDTSLSNTGDGAFRRSIVATKDLFELQNNLYSSSGYDNNAIMSLDGLLRPVSMAGGGGLPKYITNASVSKTLPVPAIAPFGSGGGDTTSLYNYNLSLSYFNPLTNPGGFNFAELQGKHAGTAGHDIDILARGTITGLQGEGRSLILPTDSGGFYNATTRADYSNDYRFLAMRFPLIGQGWGYDTDGKPIPNAADTELAASGGTFLTTGLKDSFLGDFLRKPHTWPVAPVDLRFDRKRNVWTTPPPYGFVVAELQQNINPNGSGTALIPLSEAYIADGTPITQGTIVVKDQVGFTYLSGDTVIAYYDNKTSNYNIIETKQTGSISSTIHFKLLQNKNKLDYYVSGVQIGCSGTGTYEPEISSPFLLYDNERRYYGLSGYKGYAILNTCTGNSIYEIINMEGPALYAIATLNSSLIANAGGLATGTLVQDFGPWPNDRPAIGPTGEEGIRYVVIRGDDWQGGTLPSGTKVLSTLFGTDNAVLDTTYKLIVPVSGATAGNNAIHFKLTQDKNKADLFVNGIELGCTGNQISSVVLHDREQRYIGLSGYKGYATTISCTGADEYDILNMEGPATYVVANLDSSLTTVGYTTGTLVESFGPWPNNKAAITITGMPTKVKIIGSAWQGGTLASGTIVFTTLYDDTDINDIGYKLIVPASGSGTSSRNSVYFKLTGDKRSEYTTINVRQLDYDNTELGLITVIDPMSRFFGTTGAQGIAVPISSGSSFTYSISSLEGPAQFVTATLQGSLVENSTALGTVLSYWGPENCNQQPLYVDGGTSVTIQGGDWQDSTLIAGKQVLGVLTYSGGALNSAQYKLIVPLGTTGTASGTASVYFKLTQNKYKSTNPVTGRLLQCEGEELGIDILYDPLNSFFGYSGIQGHAVPVLCNGSIRYEIVDLQQDNISTIILTGTMSGATTSLSPFTITPHSGTKCLLMTGSPNLNIDFSKQISVINTINETFTVPSNSGYIGMAEPIDLGLYKLLGVSCTKVRVV